MNEMIYENEFGHLRLRMVSRSVAQNPNRSVARKRSWIMLFSCIEKKKKGEIDELMVRARVDEFQNLREIATTVWSVGL